MEVSADGQTATGSAPQKKQARRVAAKELLDKLLDDPKVKAKGGKVVAENTVELEKVKVDNKDLWTKCIKLLPTDDEDYVKQLKIFSLNSATGLPRYKYEAAGGTAVEVTCLWNQFFLPGRGETRSAGEQAAAMAMLNKVREVCGMPAMAPRAVARKVWVPKALVTAPGEAVTADVVAVYKAVMGRGRAAVDPRGSLEELADRLGCDGPEFAISGVENMGLEVTVAVGCCWRGMEVEGRAASKRLAEAAAARAVLAELGELVARGPEQAADTSQDSVDVTYASMEARGGGEVEAGEKEEGESEDTRYCCFPLGGTASITVTRKDYECLREEQFLNDVIIDFYLKFLQHGLFAADPSVQERTHIFSIYFYERLITKPKTKLSANAPPMSPEERRYNNVKKWTKNINIFEKDFVIVPINHEEHWYVVVVCYPGLLRPRRVGDRVECPVILLLDSLEDGMKDTVVAHLREYLACEWREKMVAAGSSEVRLFQASAMPHFCPDIPQQPNLTDCGLYLLVRLPPPSPLSPGVRGGLLPAAHHGLHGAPRLPRRLVHGGGGGRQASRHRRHHPWPGGGAAPRHSIRLPQPHPAPASGWVGHQ